MIHNVWPSSEGERRGLVKNWASILDPGAQQQAMRLSRSVMVEGHVALMPDAHVGMGATIGSVFQTRNALIPAAVGVDIGCGMSAVRTNIEAAALDLGARRRLLEHLRQGIPSGVGKAHDEPTSAWRHFLMRESLSGGVVKLQLERKAAVQFGTLGAGNHFAEFSEDQAGFLWAVVHSGSRGVGNTLAVHHVRRAKDFCKRAGVHLEDPDLAHVISGTPEYAAYISDMIWAQKYARRQRQAMMGTMMDALESELPFFEAIEDIDCHHNYSEQRESGLWLTRKGAIDASPGVMGVLPGSMGTDTFIVKGLGNFESYSSAPHGAGRMGSRRWARETHSQEEFAASMEARGVVWQDRNARELLDENPQAYKPIEVVMSDASDLVVPVFTLKQIVNYKGVR